MFLIDEDGRIYLNDMLRGELVNNSFNEPCYGLFLGGTLGEALRLIVHQDKDPEPLKELVTFDYDAAMKVLAKHRESSASNEADSAEDASGK